MKNILTIALITFKEAVRNKIFYLAFFFVLVLILLATLFGSVSLGDTRRVVEDFGLFGISFMTVTYVIIAGSVQMLRELKNRTVYYLLSRPVARTSIVLGKFLGLVSVSSALALVLTTILILFGACLGFGFDWNLFLAMFSILLQIVIIIACSLLFSLLIPNHLLSGVFTFVVFLAGRSSNYILQFAQDSVSSVQSFFLKGLYYIVPHFEVLDLSNQVVYQESISKSLILWNVEYTLGFLLVVLSLASLVFKTKDL